MSVVGIPTWLGVSDPGQSTTGPITRSASAGGMTVTATARLASVVWSMGDGNTVTCAGTNAPGTRWDGVSTAKSPTCGHVYQKTSANQPQTRYTITATFNWSISWSGGGAQGTIDMDFSRSTTLRVGEIQAIITG